MPASSIQNTTILAETTLTTSSRGCALHSLAYIPSLNPDGTSVYMNKYSYNGNITVGSGLNAILNYGKHFNNELNREIDNKKRC
jgi:hypothetical protein